MGFISEDFYESYAKNNQEVLKMVSRTVDAERFIFFPLKFELFCSKLRKKIHLSFLVFLSVI